MSDYEVTLVNGKMSEFFIKFKGPAESESALPSTVTVASPDVVILAMSGQSEMREEAYLGSTIR